MFSMAELAPASSSGMVLINMAPKGSESFCFLVVLIHSAPFGFSPLSEQQLLLLLKDARHSLV